MGLRTALYEDHVKLGANIVDFAGWELPVQYTKVIEEHEATRERAGLFDIGHMGEFEITGKDAFEYLQYIFTRELKDLTPGTAMYSTMLFPNGGTIDDLFVYRLEPEKFMVVVNAANIKKDWDWIAGHIGERAVQMKDVSDSTSKIDVQGPLSAKIMGKLTNSELPARFGFTHGEVAGIKTLISRTGYTGEDGFELYCANGDASKLWNALLEAGKPEGLMPCGLGARDSLRLESGYSLYGHELSDTVSPVEAGITFVIGKNKDFIGADAVKKQIAEGATRKTIAFEIPSRGIPREQYELRKDGKKIGNVTSGTFSPTLKKGIGLALVEKGSASVGDTISVIIRDKPYEAIVVKRPFIPFRGGN